VLDAVEVDNTTGSVIVNVVPPAENAVVKPPETEVVMTPSEAQELVLPHMTVVDTHPPTICTLVVSSGPEVDVDSRGFEYGKGAVVISEARADPVEKIEYD
jgi:hypothetical protein